MFNHCQTSATEEVNTNQRSPTSQTQAVNNRNPDGQTSDLDTESPNTEHDPLLTNQSMNNNSEHQNDNPQQMENITGSSMLAYNRAQNGTETASIVRQPELSAPGNTENEEQPPEKFNLLNWVIRGKRQSKWNRKKVRYDSKSHRWYLKLDALHVKEIRAKVWQRTNDNDQ